MNGDDLSEAIGQTLTRYAEPLDLWHGPACEGSISLHDIAVAVGDAHAALREGAIIANSLQSYSLLTRILMRKEALSSSAIEGIKQ